MKIYIKRLVLTFGGIFVSSFDEVNKLTREFFNIGGQPNVLVKIDNLESLREKLVKLSNNLTEPYLQVIYLIDVIDCLLIWTLDDDKHKAREKVLHIWNIFNNKDKLTLFEIRILTAILFSAETLEEFVTITNKALTELEKFIEHDLYLVTKTILYNNLSFILMKAKYSNDKEYNDKYENILIDSTDMLISLSMQFDNSFFPRALVRKGILVKSNMLIYAGLVMLNTPDAKEKITYIRDYGIFFITHKNLL